MITQKYKVSERKYIYCIYPSCMDRNTSANSVDPDQSQYIFKKQLDKGLHCLQFSQNNLDASLCHQMDLFKF